MKKTTISYPEKKRETSDYFRGQHILKRDETGRERCTACGLCALSCPAEAIIIVAKERRTDETMLYREEKYAFRYQINMLRCIYCGNCEEACPKEAIFLTDKIVLSHYKRELLYFEKDILTEPMENKTDVTKRQTSEIAHFKKNSSFAHNK